MEVDGSLWKFQVFSELTHQAESNTFPLLSLLIQRALCSGVEPFAALIHEGAACLVAELFSSMSPLPIWPI